MINIVIAKYKDWRLARLQNNEKVAPQKMEWEIYCQLAKIGRYFSMSDHGMFEMLSLEWHHTISQFMWITEWRNKLAIFRWVALNALDHVDFLCCRRFREHTGHVPISYVWPIIVQIDHKARVCRSDSRVKFWVSNERRETEITSKFSVIRWWVYCQIAPGDPTLWRGVPVAPIQKYFGSSERDWKPGKIYRFLVNFAPNSRYGNIYIDPLMANIWNRDYFASRVVNVAWFVQAYFLRNWREMCDVFSLLFDVEISGENIHIQCNCPLNQQHLSNLSILQNHRCILALT